MLICGDIVYLCLEADLQIIYTCKVQGFYVFGTSLMVMYRVLTHGWSAPPARAAPSNSAPLAAQAPPPTVKPTGKPNAWGAPPAKPATPNDGAETHVVTSASPASWKGDATPGAVGTTQGTAPASAHKTTPPILKQLQHAQGQHAIQQKLTTERQRLDAEMKRLYGPPGAALRVRCTWRERRTPHRC